MSAHTKGPWRFELNPSNPSQWLVIASTHQTVVNYVAGGQEYARSNARLIAAAPELLEALKLLIEDPRFQVSIGGNPHAVDKAYAQCLTAIAKAEGTNA